MKALQGSAPRASSGHSRLAAPVACHSLRHLPPLRASSSLRLCSIRPLCKPAQRVARLWPCARGTPGAPMSTPCPLDRHPCSSIYSAPVDLTGPSISGEMRPSMARSSGSGIVSAANIRAHARSRRRRGRSSFLSSFPKRLVQLDQRGKTLTKQARKVLLLSKSWLCIFADHQTTGRQLDFFIYVAMHDIWPANVMLSIIFEHRFNPTICSFPRTVVDIQPEPRDAHHVQHGLGISMSPEIPALLPVYVSSSAWVMHHQGLAEDFVPRMQFILPNESESSIQSLGLCQHLNRIDI